MNLQQYRTGLGDLVSAPDLQPVQNPEISTVVNDSRRIVPGCIFCAIAGARQDGHEYLQSAVDKGAAALVIHQDFQGTVPENIPVIRVRDSYFAWSCLCETAYGKPADSLRLHTVTGTNGKTSIAFLLHYFLKQQKDRTCAMFTTVLCDTCDPAGPEGSTHTMPDAEQLQKLLLRCVHNGAKDVVLESSSHGLHQHRIGTAGFSSAIFTNLTGDHLDYHKNMESYYQAKKSLFSGMMLPDAPVVINIDDDWGKRLASELEAEKVPVQIFTLSKKQDASCRICNFTLFENHTRIEFTLNQKSWILESPLAGEHNVYNMLSALTAGAALGIPCEQLIESAISAPPAPGRLEAFCLPSGANAYVDYAHTDDALYRVLEALQNLKKENSRIITVFGCGGNRDVSKRPRMGKAAVRSSDVVFLTSDNPRFEDPEQILRDIEQGIPAGKEYFRIPDRAEAIRQAVALSRQNDLILIAGKGHEDYQEIQGIKHHFDDREQIRLAGGIPVSQAAAAAPSHSKT